MSAAGTHPSKADEALLARSEAALQSLGLPDGGPGAAAAAADALVALAARIAAARSMRIDVSASETALAARKQRALEALDVVDQGIIAAKIDAVQTFEERDHVARNLSRARATLTEIETAEHAESNDAALGLADELVRPDSLPQRLAEVEELEGQVKDALAQVEKVEAELAAVAEETDRIRSRRKMLQEKLSAAEGEL